MHWLKIYDFKKNTGILKLIKKSKRSQHVTGQTWEH